MAEDRDTLPPLPPYIYGRETGMHEKVWPASAVLAHREEYAAAYAAQAVAQERERCARVVYDATDSMHEEGDIVLKEIIAEAIRTGSPSLPPAPAGWRLVPEEATWDMRIAGSTAYREPRDGHYTARMECANDAYRAMLNAAPQPPSAWRPIEEAPRDGSMFLGWVSAVRYGEDDEGRQYEQDVSQVDFCQWRDCFDGIGGYIDVMAGDIGDAQRVTHWQPLPPPPSAGEEPT